MADYPNLELPDTTVPDTLRACIDALRAGQEHMALPSRRRMLEAAARQAEQVLAELTKAPEVTAGPTMETAHA